MLVPIDPEEQKIESAVMALQARRADQARPSTVAVGGVRSVVASTAVNQQRRVLKSQAKIQTEAPSER